jgi:hypothetical protein
MLSNYSSDTLNPSNVLDFSISQPTMIMNGTTHGPGLDGAVIDANSLLTITQEQARGLEKLTLQQRPFATVPYLGRGSCDPVLESQLQQGEVVHDKKSVSTIMEKSFNDYSMYVVDQDMRERTENAEHVVQESVLAGWYRGGTNTRVAPHS